ncbi:MAG: ATP-binding protein [Blastocatellia bacterium]|nr:ATP-binding protein [Blastocatellia bacterium]
MSPEWEALFEAMDDGVCVLDLESKIVRVNSAFTSLLGLPPEEVIGRTCADVFKCNSGADNTRKFCAREVSVDQNRSASEEICGPLPGQRLRARISPVKDAEGHATAFVMVVRDVTDIVAHERDLARVEQLARLGELAAGLAHEIKNPLAGIQGVVDILIQRRAGNDPEREALEGVRREVGRIDAIIHMLLDRARPRTFNFKPASLTESAQRAIKLARASLAPHRGKWINIEFTPPASPMIMMIDSAEIEDAILNLLLNSIEAIHDHGVIRVSIATHARDAEAEACEVAIHVADNGKGILDEHMHQIFSPFFTTNNKGTGLGLPAVRRVARAHHGRVEVKSTPGEGSTFTLFLPCPPNSNEESS